VILDTHQRQQSGPGLGKTIIMKSFRGFAQVLITILPGSVGASYATTDGWATSQFAPDNYTSGSLQEEDDYQGSRDQWEQSSSRKR